MSAPAVEPSAAETLRITADMVSPGNRVWLRGVGWRRVTAIETTQDGVVLVLQRGRGCERSRPIAPGEILAAAD